MKKPMTGIQQLQNFGTEPQKSKIKKIDLIVWGVLMYWIIFVIVAWVTFWIKDSIPDTLIQYGLGGSAIELVVTALIEISRDSHRKEKKDE